MSIGKLIMEAAIEEGATLAGIASMEAIKVSASHVWGKSGKIILDDRQPSFSTEHKKRLSAEEPVGPPRFIL